MNRHVRFIASSVGRMSAANDEVHELRVVEMLAYIESKHITSPGHWSTMDRVFRLISGATWEVVWYVSIETRRRTSPEDIQSGWKGEIGVNTAKSIAFQVMIIDHLHSLSWQHLWLLPGHSVQLLLIWFSIHLNLYSCSFICCLLSIHFLNGCLIST